MPKDAPIAFVLWASFAETGDWSGLLSMTLTPDTYLALSLLYTWERPAMKRQRETEQVLLQLASK